MASQQVDKSFMITKQQLLPLLLVIAITPIIASPGRMVPLSGGVLMVLPLRTKMLQLDTSSR
jgi:hypothetical protein